MECGSTHIIIANTMDKFDDLPDDIPKDTRPKFQTEIHKTVGKDGNTNPAGGVSNGLEPLFQEEPVADQKEQQDKDDKVEAEEGSEQP